MLVFARMNRILALDMENHRAVVQPGVVNYELTRAAEPYGLYFAPDPSSWKSCTIGGNVAENAGGPHTLAYGVTTNHVTALQLVLPGGEIVRVGSRHGDTPCYDLTGLFVGSEGTLALVTEITVKLSRKPEAVKTLLAIFDSVDDAADTVVDITARAITPAACEMLDGWTLRTIEDYIHAGFPMDSAAVLLVEVEGLTETVAAQATRSPKSATRIMPAKSASRATTPSATSSGKAARTLSARSAAWPPAITSSTASFRVRNFRKLCAASGKSAINTAFKSATSFTPGTATCTPSCSTIPATRRNSSAPSKPPPKSSAIASKSAARLPASTASAWKNPNLCRSSSPTPTSISCAACTTPSIPIPPSIPAKSSPSAKAAAKSASALNPPPVRASHDLSRASLLCAPLRCSASPRYLFLLSAEDCPVIKASTNLVPALETILGASHVLSDSA